MKKQFFIVFSTVLILLTQNLQAQKVPLPGDSIHDFALHPVLSGKSVNTSIGKLSAEKLLILNFWASWCVPCIQEMSYLDSLKAKNPYLLNVLSVNYEDSSKVKKILLERGLRFDHLNLLFNDTRLHDYFPHRSIPHNIWIKQSRILAITTGESINEKNIREFTSRQKELPLKDDDLSFSSFNPMKAPDSLFSRKKNNYRSVLLPYNPRTFSGISYGGDREGNSRRLFAYNLPVLSILWAAFVDQKNSMPNLSRIELNVENLTTYLSPKQNTRAFRKSKYAIDSLSFAEQQAAWQADHLFNYEIILQKSRPVSQVKRYIYQDIERNFDIRVSERTGKRQCLVVSAISPALFNSLKSISKVSVIDYQNNQMIIQNKSIRQILEYLEATFGTEDILIDESGVNEGIDVNLDLDPKEELSSSLILKKLEQKGIKFRWKTRRVNILCISDKIQ